MELIKQSIPLFAGWSKQELHTALKLLQAYQKTYLKDEIMITEGEPVSEISILLQGRARSMKYDVHGRQVLVTVIEPNDYIGVLLAVSHSRTSPVCVQACEDCRVLYIPIQ